MSTRIHLRFFEARREHHVNNTLRKISYWLELGEKIPNGKEIDAAKDPELSLRILRDLVGHILKGRFEVAEKKEESDFTIMIALIDNQAMNSPRVYEQLLKKNSIRMITDPYARKLHPDFVPYPMIIIGVDNIMNLKLDGDEANMDESLPRLIRKRIDPRFRFFDSSIWHRYISVNPSRSFNIRLTDLVTELVKYYSAGLYNTIVGQEYLEFQCRKLQNSYVKNYPGGHAKKVTPFRFHSESNMRTRADKILKASLGPYTWGCLLVDDYANRRLRTKDHSANGVQTTAKLDWIEQLINRRINGNPVIDIRNPRGIVKDRYEGGYISLGIQQIKEKHPDIIILDYFFGIEETKPEEQYGHKLIDRIRTWEKMKLEELDDSHTAFGDFWIFPISGFEHAFRSHLRTMGESTDGDYIRMMDGADPINSPELFRYLFYKALLIQEETVGIRLGSIIQKILKDLIVEEHDEEFDISDLDSVLDENYHELTETLTLIRALVKKRSESRFSQTYLAIVDKVGIMENLCQNIQRLAYLISHSPGADWKGMNDTLDLIDKIIGNLSYSSNESGVKLQQQLKDGRRLLKLVENYIVSLKNEFE